MSKNNFKQVKEILMDIGKGIPVDKNQIHRTVASLTEEMADAAAKAEWERVFEIETKRDKSIAQAKELDSSMRVSSMTEQEVEERKSILKSILDADRRFKNAAEPRFRELESILSAQTSNNRARKAYGG